MNQIRLGLIGCGTMTLTHAKGFKHLSERGHISATCDIVEERAKEAAALAGANFFTTDYKELLEHVDAVLVVLPHHLHFECGMFFLENGKHVLMEKPLCNTEEECITLVEEAEKRNLVLMCAYPVPFWRGIQKLKSLLDSGEYGEIFQMSVWTEQYTDAFADWIASAEKLGGGQLFSHGCHYIDLILRFLGNPVSGIHLGSNKGTPWMEREGTSNVVMTFENGVMAYHFGTWGARGTSLRYNVQIHTDCGFFEYQHEQGKLIFRATEGPYESKAEEIIWTFEDSANSKQTHHEINHFFSCITEGKLPLTDGRSSIQSLRVIWKLYEAEEKNTIADLRGLGLHQA